MKALITRLRTDPRLATRAAATICVLVAFARVALALATPAPALTPDGIGYDDAARRLATDGAYAWRYAGDETPDPAPNAMHPPGYPVFLAGLYALAGPDVSAQPLVSVVQGVLSALTLWALFLIGRRITSAAVGLAAVALGAAYVPLWLSYRYVLTEDLFALLCAWAAWAAIVGVSGTGRRAPVAFVAAGSIAALALYVRAAAALWLVVAAFLLIGLGGQQRARYARGVAVALMTIVVAMSPWWVRNARIYGEFVPFNTMTAAGSLVAAHDDPAELAADLGSIDRGHLEPSEEIAYNQEVAELARARSRRAWAEEGIGYPLRRLRQLAISIFTYHPNPWGGFAGLGAVVEAIHLALLALAARGAWLWRRAPGVWIIIALPTALVVLHAATLAFSRYFLPMMPLVIVLAALGTQAGGPGSPPARQRSV